MPSESHDKISEITIVAIQSMKIGRRICVESFHCARIESSSPLNLTQQQCRSPTSHRFASEIESVHIHWQEIRIKIIGEIAWVESSTIHLPPAKSDRVQPHSSVQMPFDLVLVLHIGHEFNPFVVNLSVLYDLLVVRLFSFPFFFFFVIYRHGNAQRIRINRLRTNIFSCVCSNVSHR